MTPRPRRAPLSDLSNLTHIASSPSPAGDPTFRPASKPINAKGVLSQQASPSSSESLSHGGGRDASGAPAPVCQTPLSTAPMAMEVDPCLSTPRAMEPDDPSSLSSKEGNSIIYSRRKTEAPSHLTMSCPPPCHHLKERNLTELNNRRKAVKRGISAAMLSEDGGSKAAPSSRSRRHSLPNLQPKQWLPEDFVAAQRSHFAEVDAFQLIEEEGELSDEG